MRSPSALSPSGNPATERNPFDSEFIEEEAEEEIDEEFQNAEEESNFAVLNSSLPLEQGAQQHHLASYASAKRVTGAKEKKHHRTRWHFGIRSRSPPMEVMSAIYASLKSLGMEWKEKKDFGGLCAFHPKAKDKPKIERNREWDAQNHRIDLRAASSVYFVETRARQGDVIVSNLFCLNSVAIAYISTSGLNEHTALFCRW